MNELDELCLELLGELEDKEYLSLQWGFVDGRFTFDEVEEAANDLVENHQVVDFTGTDIAEQLIDRKLLLEIPGASDCFRSRFAELIRLLAKLRQLFPESDWREGKSLVSDYRLLIKKRSFPDFEHLPASVIQRLAPNPVAMPFLQQMLKEQVGGFQSRNLANFQLAATEHIREKLAIRASSGTIICAGTGSGKTLAAYLPALLEVNALVESNIYWTKMLCLYPRNELLKDQLAKILRETERLKDTGKRPITVGAFFQSVPSSSRYLKDTAGWERNGPGYVCPFMICPKCDGKLRWYDQDVEAQNEVLNCVDCHHILGSDRIVLTRSRMVRNPPDLLFSSTESLNRQIASSKYRKIFGIGCKEDHTPRIVLLDEVHTYEGIPGAQVALLLRRWQSLAKFRDVEWIGLSATLKNPEEFFSQITGLPIDKVKLIKPGNELKESGKDYMVALRGDAASRTSLLSTSLQAIMLLARMLDPQPTNIGQNYSPPSEGIYGQKAFLFTDDLDVTNRFFHDLLDAEARGKSFWKSPLADLRSSALEEPEERDLEGQNWWGAEEIGHSLHLGQGLRVSRTSSQDRGVDELSNVVVCTAALEVGFDDDTVGAVLQHKAPMNLASFLQRKGRAGRPRKMRPITVMVLSDYGRDRIAYQSPEQIFAPTLDPKRLPLRNRYVLRMQAVFSLMDWFAKQASLQGFEYNIWTVLEGPGEYKSVIEGQKWLLQLVNQILEHGERMGDLIAHLEQSLFVDRNEILRLLWDHPRPIMTAVLPTIRRRLASDWRTQTDPNANLDLVRQFNPLPDFVPSSLFSELQLPELAIEIPQEDIAEQMPLLQGMQAFVPGKVSRRFSGSGGEKSHWIPILGVEKEDIQIQAFCDQYYMIGNFDCFSNGLQTIKCFRPLNYRIEECDENHVSVGSTARLNWHSQIFNTSEGMALPVESDYPISAFAPEIFAFTHGQTRPIKVRRFANGANALYREQKKDHPVSSELKFIRKVNSEGNAEPVALGFEIEVDGILVKYVTPDLSVDAISEELLRELRPQFFAHLLENDAALSEYFNFFQIGWVAEIHVSALANAFATTASSLEESSNLIWNDYEKSVGSVMEKVIAGHAHEDHSDLQKELGFLLAKNEVQARIRALERVLWEPLADRFIAWLEERMAATLGGAFIEACRRISSRATEDDLLLDISGGIDPKTKTVRPNELWITESSPGGNGVIEDIVRRISNDPVRFYHLVEDCLSASEFEIIDEQLADFIKSLAQSSQPLTNLVSDIRTADSQENFANAQESLVRFLETSEFVFSRPLLVALNARILTAGSATKRDELLHSMLLKRAKLEEDIGFNIGYREFAYIASEDKQISEALETLLGYINEPRRFQVAVGLLWPRASLVRTQNLGTFNPFHSMPIPNRLLATCFSQFDIPTTKPWINTPDLKAGATKIRVSIDDTRELKDWITSVVSTPVEVGFLHNYPRVVGITREKQTILLTLNVSEAI